MLFPLSVEVGEGKEIDRRTAEAVMISPLPVVAESVDIDFQWRGADEIRRQSWSLPGISDFGDPDLHPVRPETGMRLRRHHGRRRFDWSAAGSDAAGLQACPVFEWWRAEISGTGAIDATTVSHSLSGSRPDRDCSSGCQFGSGTVETSAAMVSTIGRSAKTGTGICSGASAAMTVCGGAWTASSVPAPAMSAPRILRGDDAYAGRIDRLRLSGGLGRPAGYVPGMR